MNDTLHDESFGETFSEAILYEFSSGGIPIDDEVKSRPRRYPQWVLDEKARLAAALREELNKPSVSPKTDESQDADK